MDRASTVRLPSKEGPVTDREPFDQMPFQKLPDRPRRPHGYDETERRRIEIETPDFGPVETHYRTAGEGPPLLLVHGLMTSSYAWRYAFPLLSGEFRLYAPDLPGAGETDKPVDADYDPVALASWIGAFQEAVEIRGAPAVGNSLGGYLCMWLALSEPDALGPLVNVHSPGIPTSRLKFLGAAAAVPGIERFIAWLARRNPERWAHRHVHYFDESLKSREEAAAYGKPLSTSEGSRTFAKYLTETLATDRMVDFVDRLEQLRSSEDGFPVPLDLIYADRDPVVPPDIGERLAELVPEASLTRMSGVSHFVQVDAPDRFADRVREFLEDPPEA